MGENISRAIENRLLQRICHPKRDITRSWRKLHGNKLHDVFCLPNINQDKQIKYSERDLTCVPHGRDEICI
jgi:hypothetical protein